MGNFTAEENPDDTARVDREEMQKVAEQEAERERFESAGGTTERSCLTSYHLKIEKNARNAPTSRDSANAVDG